MWKTRWMSVNVRGGVNSNFLIFFWLFKETFWLFRFFADFFTLLLDFSSRILFLINKRAYTSREDIEKAKYWNKFNNKQNNKKF